MILYDTENTFMKQDIRKLIQNTEYELCNMHEIYSDSESRFEKRKEYLDFVKNYIKNHENVIFLARSFISDKEFPPAEWCLDYQKVKSGNENKQVINDKEIVARENDIFKDAGFVDINELIGYEYGHAFIYPNTAGKFIINEIYKGKDKEKIKAYISTSAGYLFNNILLAEESGNVKLIDNGESEENENLDIVISDGIKDGYTGYEKYILEWNSGYLSTDQLIEYLKEYDEVIASLTSDRLRLIAIKYNFIYKKNYKINNYLKVDEVLLAAKTDGKNIAWIYRVGSDIFCNGNTDQLNIWLYKTR